MIESKNSEKLTSFEWNDKQNKHMSDAIKHECGIALLRLKKPLSLLSR